MLYRFRTLMVVVLVIFFAALSVGFVAEAFHAWGGYHWARTSNPFILKLGDNVSSVWNGYLTTTSNDWSKSSVLDTVIVPGGTTPKHCRPTQGRAEVCNNKYGRNSWLGMASIWASGNHITQATVKMNDTYFNTATYNTPVWRNLVMCQEVGHIFGLDHQDEIFNNPPLGTCMDYSNDPTPNQHPNQHDYDMLETIYVHLDSVTTVSQKTAQNIPDIDTDNPREWGKKIRESRDGRVSLHERDLGQGNKVFTFVFWAEPDKQHEKSSDKGK